MDLNGSEMLSKLSLGGKLISSYLSTYTSKQLHANKSQNNTFGVNKNNSKLDLDGKTPTFLKGSSPYSDLHTQGKTLDVGNQLTYMESKAVKLGFHINANNSKLDLDGKTPSKYLDSFKIK